MALHSPGVSGTSSSVSRLLSSAKLSSTKTLFSVDFVGSYYISKGTKRRNDLSGLRGYSPLLKSSLRYPLSAKAILNSDRAAGDASASFSDLKPEVAYLEDIISERGACGVGFIANLENKATHKIVNDALIALGCMEHRGGCGSDNTSGDGSGLMTSIPWDLFNEWAVKEGMASFDKIHTGVGMLFLPRDDNIRKEAKKVITSIFEKEGLEVLGWRDVPVEPSIVGHNAKETMPKTEQVFVRIVKDDKVDDVERELYLCRKLIERAVASESWASELYFSSLSNQTIVYKGMLRSEVLGLFYPDLQNDLYKSAFAIYHRRFSTNTSPRWHLAQPMRFLGHNGEINTIQGNLNWMTSREASLRSPVWHGRENDIRPISNPKASDSSNLDSAAELLIRSGRTPEESLMILVPEAYKNHPTLMIKYPEAVDFYDYYKGQMEPWDGPALVLFSDGKTVGACLDRNGLRPARYWRTSDNVVYVASEILMLKCHASGTVAYGSGNAKILSPPHRLQLTSPTFVSQYYPSHYLLQYEQNKIYHKMGQALNTAKGKGEVDGKDLEAMAENCYRKRFEEQNDDQDWSFGDFYRIVAEAVEEINRRLGGTQLKVPSVDKLQEAYERHNLGEGKKISKDEFQKLLQEVLIGAGFTGVGGVKEFLLFIFGVPTIAVFLKNRIAPTSIPNDLFIPAVTSATVFLLAKLNKI